MSYEMKLNDLWRYLSNLFNATDRVGSKTFTPRVMETVQPDIAIWPYFAGQHYEKRLEALDIDPNPAKVLSCESGYWYVLLGALSSVALTKPYIYYTSPEDELSTAICCVGNMAAGDTLFTSLDSNISPSLPIHDGSMGDLYIEAEVGIDDVDIFIRYIKIRKPMTIIGESTA